MLFIHLIKIFYFLIFATGKKFIHYVTIAGKTEITRKKNCMIYEIWIKITDELKWDLCIKNAHTS